MPVVTRSAHKANPDATPLFAPVAQPRNTPKPKINDVPIILKNGVRLLSQKELKHMRLMSEIEPSKVYCRDRNVVPINEDLVQHEYFLSEEHGIKTKEDCYKLGKKYALAPNGYIWYMRWYRFCSGMEEWLLIEKNAPKPKW